MTLLAMITASFALLAGSSYGAILRPRTNLLSPADSAGGATPNSDLPANVSDAAVQAFQGVNCLENLEARWHFDLAIDIVTKVQAQEVIHIQTAEKILNHLKKLTFAPSKYCFLVSNPEEFFSLANIITSVGIGAVINLASSLALTDPTLVPGPASILAVEARHDVFFRVFSGVSMIPNPAPFDTGISAAYALNLAAPFIVNGSCKSMPEFPRLTRLKAAVSNKTMEDISNKVLYIGWVNQANVVVYTPAKVVGDKVTSNIPAGLGGLAFAALTAQKDVKDVDALTSATLAGPAPVQIS